MKELKVKYQVGMLLIVSHLFIIGSLIFLRFLNGYSTEEFTTTIGIITPMFAGYSIAIISYIIKDRHRTTIDKKVVTKAFAFLLFLFPTIFSLLVLGAIWLKAYNLGFSNFEDFKTIILSLESIFAIYTGMFVYTLFPKVETPTEIN